MSDAVAPPRPRRWWIGPVFGVAYLLGTVVLVGGAMLAATMALVQPMIPPGSAPPADGREIAELVGLGRLAAITAVQFAGMLLVAVLLAPLLPMRAELLVPREERGRPPFGLRILDAFAVRRTGAWYWMPAAVLLGCTAGQLPSWISEELGRLSGQEQTVEQMMTLLSDAPLASAVAMAGVVTLFGPAIEELVFRGFLYSAFDRSFPPWVTIVATSAIFAAFHLDPLQMVAVFPLGLVMGWLRWETGGLWAPLVLHVVNNSIAAVLTWAGAAGGGGSEIDLPVTVASTVVAVGAALGARAARSRWG